MTPNTKRLRIVEASFLFSLTEAEATHDINKLITLNADIYMGTESGDQEMKSLFRRIFMRAGYVVYLPAGTDTWIAVKAKLAGAGHAQGYREIVGSGKEIGDPHHFDAKGDTWFAFHNPLIGHVGLTVCHYMRTNVKGDKAKHIAINRRLARANAGKVIDLAVGPERIGFMAADTNMLDEHSDVFFGMPLTTCWDELGKYPNTGHGNIDVIASVDSDEKRVTLKSAKVLNDASFFQHMDHFVVVCEYNVRKLDRKG